MLDFRLEFIELINNWTKSLVMLEIKIVYINLNVIYSLVRLVSAFNIIHFLYKLLLLLYGHN